MRCGTSERAFVLDSPAGSPVTSGSFATVDGAGVTTATITGGTTVQKTNLFTNTTATARTMYWFEGGFFDNVLLTQTGSGGTATGTVPTGCRNIQTRYGASTFGATC